MKMMKRILALVFCFAMLLALCIPAMAYNDYTVWDDENHVIEGDASFHIINWIGKWGSTLTIKGNVQIDGLYADPGNGTRSLVVLGKLYSEHCLFFHSECQPDIVLGENGVIDLAEIERDIDLDLEALRAKGYCVYYENRHLIISFKHHEMEEGSSCTFCRRECCHPEKFSVIDNCPHCGIIYPDIYASVAYFREKPKNDYSIYGIHNYDNLTIDGGVFVTVDERARIQCNMFNINGQLTVCGSMIANADSSYFDGNIDLKENGTIDLYMVSDDPEALMTMFREKGAGCVSYDGERLHASTKHHYERKYDDEDRLTVFCKDCGEQCVHEKRNGAVCAECGNVEEHDHVWNDGVCTLCRRKCSEHSFDANGVCFECGHVRTIEDTLQDWITEDLVIPAGKYTTTELRIEPGVTVTVEKGAELRFTVGINTYEATLVIRGSVIGFIDETFGFGKMVGTVVLEEDGMIDIMGNGASIIGSAGVGNEFIAELKNNKKVVKCAFDDRAGYLHFATRHVCREDGNCFYCGASEVDINIASILADGSIWIIVGVAIVVAGGVVAFVIVRKKKSTVKTSFEQ